MKITFSTITCACLIMNCFLLRTEAQTICIDTIYITYEPFEARNRFVKAIEEFDKLMPTDTITDINEFVIVTGIFQEVLSQKNKQYSNEFAPKILVRLNTNGKELFRFYYTGSRNLYVNGGYFLNDKGLLQKLLELMNSDDRFQDEFKRFSPKNY